MNIIEKNTLYIPEEHDKYNLLPNCHKYNFEIIIYDGWYLRKIKEVIGLNDYETDPYQKYKSYKEFFNEIDGWISRFPNSKKEIIEYQNNVIKLNNKDLWGIVKYVGKTDWSFTKNKYYYVVMYKENNNWVIDGIIDNEEYNSFQVWSEKCSDPVDLMKDFEITVDPSKELRNIFKTIMNSLKVNK